MRGGHKTSRVAALDPDNATILVAGGGGIALETVKILKDIGAWTYMMQRTDTRKKQLEEMNVVVVRADAMEKQNVESKFAAIDGLDAVVSTIGGPLENPLPDSEGNINLIEAALKAKVKRFVLVSSVGVGNSKSAISNEMYTVLEPVLVEKEKAEAKLQALGEEMEYVIIRPGGLKKEDGRTDGVLTEDVEFSGVINRSNTAQLVVKALFSDEATNKVLHAFGQEDCVNRVNPEKQLKGVNF